MILRRLGISLVATSALILATTAPALAEHAEPFHTFDGENLKTCDGPVEDVLTDQGYEAEFFWQESKDVDSPDDIIEHNWWTVTITDDLQFLTVDGHSVPEGDFLIVLVKGGNATNMFVGPDLKNLYAPAKKSGGHAQISNYTICKFKGEKVEEDDETPSATPTSTTPATPTSTPSSTSTPQPTKTPAPVPTEVPAGGAAGSANGSSMGPVGIAAAALMVMAGGAALLRRRFAHQN